MLFSFAFGFLYQQTGMGDGGESSTGGEGGKVGLDTFLSFLSV